jgi:hypothetical protein
MLRLTRNFPNKKKKSFTTYRRCSIARKWISLIRWGDKLADLRADQILLMRKEDGKLVALIELLKQQKIISTESADQIMALEPFPR